MRVRSLVRMGEVKGRREAYVTIVGFQGTVRSGAALSRGNQRSALTTLDGHRTTM
jgi:hypothetical protein